MPPETLETTAPAAASPAVPDSAPDSVPSSDGSTPTPALAAVVPGGSTPPDSAADQRVRDAQRKMHAATTEAAEWKTQAETLRQKLEGLGINLTSDPAGTQPVAPTRAEPRPAPAEPGSPPAPDEWDQLFETYSDTKLDERTAFRKLFADTYPEVLAKRLSQHPALLTGIFKHVRQEALREQRMDGATRSIQEFWQQAAPEGTPVHLAWNYAAEAQAAHPTDLLAQAQYALDRLLKDLGPLASSRAAHQTETLTRDQTTVLPGGGASSPGTGGGAVPSMIDQMRARQRPPQ